MAESAEPVSLLFLGDIIIFHLIYLYKLNRYSTIVGPKSKFYKLSVLFLGINYWNEESEKWCS